MFQPNELTHHIQHLIFMYNFANTTKLIITFFLLCHFLLAAFASFVPFAFFSTAGFMDSKTWFAHINGWYIDLYKWSTFSSDAPRGFRWMDIENQFTATAWFRHIRMSSIDGTQNQSSISASRYRWVEFTFFFSLNILQFITWKYLTFKLKL